MSYGLHFTSDNGEWLVADEKLPVFYSKQTITNPDQFLYLQKLVQEVDTGISATVVPEPYFFATFGVGKRQSICNTYIKNGTWWMDVFFDSDPVPLDTFDLYTFTTVDTASTGWGVNIWDSNGDIIFGTDNNKPLNIKAYIDVNLSGYSTGATVDYTIPSVLQNKKIAFYCPPTYGFYSTLTGWSNRLVYKLNGTTIRTDHVGVFTPATWADSRWERNFLLMIDAAEYD